MNAPNDASGPIPEDVKPYFEGPYYEWWNAEKVTWYQPSLCPHMSLYCDLTSEACTSICTNSTQNYAIHYVKLPLSLRMRSVTE